MPGQIELPRLSSRGSMDMPKSSMPTFPQFSQLLLHFINLNLVEILLQLHFCGINQTKRAGPQRLKVKNLKNEKINISPLCSNPPCILQGTTR
jgi:hypothetical protein